MKRTRRATRKTITKSTHSVTSASKFDAAHFWSEFEQKMKELRDWVEKQIEPKAKRASTSQKQRKGKIPKKRGPKPFSDAVLDLRRNALVRFLEAHWPELVLLCGPEPDARALKRALIKFAKSPSGDSEGLGRIETFDDHGAAAQRLLDNFDQLTEFLTKHQKRFAGDPRQIANAIAGCPEIRFWTSQKRCQKLPFRTGIDERAMRSYIQRNHPKLYDELSRRHTMTELADFCRNYRTRDEILIGLGASDFERFWKKGISRELNP